MKPCCKSTMKEVNRVIDEWGDNTAWHVFDIDIDKLKARLKELEATKE